MNRRRYLAASTAVAVSGCLNVQRTDGNGTGTGKSSGTDSKPASTGTVRPPRGGWQFQTPAPPSGVPAVTNGSVFVPSGDKRVYAIDRSSGKRRWRYDLGTAATGQPAVIDGTVVIAAPNGLVGIDAESGNLRWSASGSDLVTRSPVVGAGTVVSGTARSLVGLDPRNGDHVWEQHFEAQLVNGGITPSGKRAVVMTAEPSQSATLHSVELRNGTKANSVSLDLAPERPRISLLLTTASTTVLATSQYGLAGFDRSTGSRLWSQQYAAGAHPRATLSADLLFAKSLFEVGTGVVALSPNDGTVRWADPLKEGGECCHAAPVVANGLVLAPNRSAGVPLAGLDSATGTLRWEYSGDFSLRGGIGIEGRDIFFGGSDGAIHSLHLE